MVPKDSLARLAESGTPPDPECALRISVGLGKKLRLFREETLPFLTAGGSGLHFIYAEYGRGKTHLLWALREIARQQGFVTAYIDCAAHLSPFSSLRLTYSQVANNIEPPGPGQLCQERGIKALISRAVLRFSSTTIKDFIKGLRSDGNLVSDFRNLVAAYARSFRLENQSDLLTQELGALLTANPLTSITIRDLYHAYPWLPRPIGKLTNRNAAAWIRSLASLPKALGFPGFVVLFDETEKTHSMKRLTRKARREHLVNLRNLVDHMAIGAFRGCVIYYAVVEEFVEIAQEELEPLFQRIERIRLGYDRALRNHRAVWANLDELTQPSPEDPAFFEGLAASLLSLGQDAGLTAESARLLMEKLKEESLLHANHINPGTVRQFVKLTAGQIAVQLARTEGGGNGD